MLSMRPPPRHVVRFVRKILFDAFLDRQRLDGPGAGDAFVEVAGDPRIDLADLAVDADQPGLEQAEEHDDGRQDQQDEQRQARIDDQHDHGGADQIA